MLRKPFLATLLAAAVLLPALPATAQRAPARVPADNAEVLERLPRGFSASTARLPGATAPPAQILALLSLAARTGDTRLSDRAQALLDAHPADATDPVLVSARAFSAQHQHEFETAVMHLDRVIELTPREGNAWLSRAQIHLVQGHIDRARRGCVALTLRVDASLGSLCTAALSLRTGRLDTAAELTDRWLASAAGDTDLRRYALVMRGEIASRAGDPGTDGWFDRALALVPGDVRTLAAYSRHLRHAGRPAEAARLLDGERNSEGLLLELALAAQAAGRPDARALGQRLERRMRLATTAQSPVELRDEAEFYLSLRNAPRRALGLAAKNFETQRDHEDVDLLLRAAHAAGQPDALAGLRAWAAAQRVELPQDANR